MKVRGFVLVSLGALVGWSCAESPVDRDVGSDAASIVVNSSEIALPVGQSRQIAVTVLDSNGDLIADAQPTFTSSDDGIAAVEADGLVRGIAAGDVVITIRAGDLIARVPVRVHPATVASLTIHPPEFALPLGETQQLRVSVRDPSGNEIPDPSIAYTSDDESAATVDADGVVRAVSVKPGFEVGIARIAATAGGVTATAEVLVGSFVVPVEIAPAEAEIQVGGRLQLVGTIRGEDGEEICSTGTPGCTLAWSTSDRTVAVASPQGVVTGLARGTVTVYGSLNAPFPDITRSGWMIVTVD